MLIGATMKSKILCISSLSNEIARKPEPRIKKDGIKRQCATHASDKIMDNLSVFN